MSNSENLCLLSTQKRVSIFLTRQLLRSLGTLLRLALRPKPWPVQRKNDGLPTGNVLFLSLNGFCLNSESHTALCPWRKPVLVVTLCNTTSGWRAYIAAMCQESHCPECRMTLQLQCAPNLGLTGNGRSLNFLIYTLGGTFRKGPLEAINWLPVWARPF